MKRNNIFGGVRESTQETKAIIRKEPVEGFDKFTSGAIMTLIGCFLL
jgi:hypothetical protein